MITQLTINEAFERFLAGEDVKMLCPSVMNKDDWSDMFPTTLLKVLDGALFFGEAVRPEQSKPEQPAEDPEPEPLTVDVEQEEPEQPKRRKLDTGKIKSLYEAGWSQTAIAEEMGCSPSAISMHVKKMYEEG